jgi:GTP cyclohydrolase I
MDSISLGETMSVSDRIKKRLEMDGKRYYAADNISKYLSAVEKAELIEELTKKFEGVLDTLIIDRETDPNSIDTPRRLAKMYILEIMGGRYDDDPRITAFPNDGKYDQLITVRMDLTSMCSHHFQPVNGVCYVACMPGEEVIGLSKYTRVAQHLASRGHLQEELCEMIAYRIEKLTKSKAVGVYIKARHGCCENRGIRASNSSTQTTVLKGELKTNPSLKEEFMDNIKLQEMNGGHL